MSLSSGAGQAGVQAAEALRSGGFTRRHHLLGDEPHGPYHRPPLSKAWLAGEIDAAQLVMRAPEMLARKGITAHRRARARHRPRRADGGAGRRQQAALHGPGAGHRLHAAPPAAAGADAPNVLPLRTRDEASAWPRELARCVRIAVAGGGDRRRLHRPGSGGHRAQEGPGRHRAGSRAAPAGPRAGAAAVDWYAALHRGHGVQVVLGARVAAGIDTGADGLACAVRMADGQRACRPAWWWWASAWRPTTAGARRRPGLRPWHRGRRLRPHRRPAIVAAGDCTARRLADGSCCGWSRCNNATEQGKSAAAALLGQERPFTATPWFWSDQYDRKLQMAGLSHRRRRLGAARQPAGGPGVFGLPLPWAGKLMAVDTVNAAKDHLLARKLLDAGRVARPMWSLTWAVCWWLDGRCAKRCFGTAVLRRFSASALHITRPRPPSARFHPALRSSP
jgi:3-phenylpropionate/trans-cinnamate dioxygenase ferredoxin reductase subunit